MNTPNIKTLISAEDVQKRVQELGRTISRDYAGKSLHIICILKGGVYFACDLARAIDVPVTMDFMCISSYGNEKSSSGIVKIVKDLDDPLEGRDVLIAEDIIDSGRTLHYLVPVLQKRNPASIEICTLLSKPDRRVVDVPVKYTGFTVPDEFVVGCGMDYAQRYRNLPYIGVVEE